MEVPDDLREMFISQVETINSSLIALAGCIDQEGDVRDMVLRTGLSAANTLLHFTEKWMYPEEEEPVELEPRRVATDDPATCGHPEVIPDLLPLGQRMCKTCGASQREDGSWAVL